VLQELQRSPTSRGRKLKYNVDFGSSLPSTMTLFVRSDRTLFGRMDRPTGEGGLDRMLQPRAHR